MRKLTSTAQSTFKAWLCIAVFLLLAQCAIPQAVPPQSSADLEQVLGQMDEAAGKFRTTQAAFTWIQYNEVINDIADTQKGKIYFRRSGRDIQMAADFSEPDNKQLIFSDGKIQVFQPKTGQVDVYDASAHKEEFESFLVLGFGGGGHDMLKSFEVKYLGRERIGDTEAEKLDLFPKAEKVKQNFSHILLWIDPQRGISVQQQLFQTSGDYRLAKYSDIQLNQKISENAFKLRTNAKTKVLSH
jgi:outer membrane lipoprotein-sorting protein